MGLGWARGKGKGGEGVREGEKGWHYQQKEHTHITWLREGFTTILQKSQKKDLGTPTGLVGLRIRFFLLEGTQTLESPR